jgi:hypothetical protein
MSVTNFMCLSPIVQLLTTMQPKAKENFLSDVFRNFILYWNIMSMTIAYYSRSVPYHYDFSHLQSK